MLEFLAIVVFLGVVVLAIRRSQAERAQREAPRLAAQDAKIRCQHCGESGHVSRGQVRQRVSRDGWTHVTQWSCSNCGSQWT